MKLIASALLLIVLSSISEVSGEHHKLIVVLIDGFRWDYIDFPKLKLQGLQSIVKNGVKAEYLKPVYPSLTYPNMMSFATGLYPETHGFVDNMLWDNETDTFFEMLPSTNSTDPMWWQGGEPVWVTAQKNSRKAALYWWPGCEVRIHGQHPQVCERQVYSPPTDNLRLDMLQRVDDVVEMFGPSKVMPTDRLDLAMMYYGSVDWAGHFTGFDSPEFTKAISDIDEVIDYIQRAVHKAGLTNKVNIMVVSDHGMADVRNSKFISLDKFDDLIKYQVNSGPISSLVPEDGQEEALHEAIKNDEISGLHVYRKFEIPEWLHTRNAKRLGPIVLECDQAYFVKALTNTSKRVGDIAYYDYYGEHGYAPQENEDMRATFVAIGPDFKSGVQVKAFDIIDLYNVMCHVLRIDPAPNNGTWEHVEPMLRTQADGPYYSDSAETMRGHSYVACISVVTLLLTSLLHLLFQ